MAKTVKKTVRKAAPKAVAVKPAVAAATPSCGCGCRCICWKKILIFVLGIAVGAAGCCLLKCCCKKKMHKFGPMPELTFVNGCLDMSKISCPDKLKEVSAKDANKDGCITREELFGDRAQRGPQGPRKPRAPRPAQQ